jgi:hypothetical protein
MILRVYRLCRAFSCLPKDLGVPQEDERLFLLGFEMILDREEKEKVKTDGST